MKERRQMWVDNMGKQKTRQAGRQTPEKDS